MQYRYTLQTYAGMQSRYTCPQCNKPKIFCRYMDTESGQHIHASVGRCNRIINCGYHYTPKQYFLDHGPQILDDRRQTTDDRKLPPSVVRGPSSINAAILNQSLVSKAPNHFLNWLTTLFGATTMQQLRNRYYIGTANHWQGATVFWQVDENEHIRTGKIMLYNPDTGKRVKEPYNHITWAHTLLKQPAFSLQQCLFGEHLLRTTTKPIAITESEKTALIASVYLPQFTWLAAGSLTNLTAQKCQALKGHKVYLFPDLNAYDKWVNQAKQLTCCASISVSDLLERHATDLQKEEGLDLGDYLVGLGDLRKNINSAI